MHSVSCYTLENVIGSATRLGDFWKLLATYFIAKVAQIFGKLIGLFEKHHGYSKNCCACIFATFEEIWATFYSTVWSHWDSEAALPTYNIFC